jgi:hypothetical protein
MTIWIAGDIPLKYSAREDNNGEFVEDIGCCKKLAIRPGTNSSLRPELCGRFLIIIFLVTLS